MKKFFSILAIAILACSSVFAADENKVIDKNLNVGVFEKIILKGSDKIVYTQGDKVSVRIHGVKEQVDAVIVNKNGNTLEVSRKSSINNGMGLRSLFNAINNGQREESLVIYVTSPDIIGITLMGSGDFVGKGKIDTDNLDIFLQGSGDIDLDDIVCDNIKVKTQGSGDIEINKVESITSDIYLQGSGDIKVRQQNVRKTTIDLYGSGDIDVDCTKCDVINANLTGSGDITISGSYNKVNKNKRGSGDISLR